MSPPPPLLAFSKKKRKKKRIFLLFPSPVESLKPRPYLVYNSKAFQNV